MTRRRVLILCHSFPPKNHVAAMRGVRIGNAFLKRGWDVEILKSAFGTAPDTLDVDTSAFRIHSYQPNWLSRTISEAPVRRSPKALLLFLARQLVHPDHSWLMWQPISKAIDELGGLAQFDCVVSSAFPFVLHDVVRARRENGERFLWVADTRDMWAGSPYRPARLRPSSSLFRVEARTFALCDIATFASETTANVYASRYDRQTMLVLNGVEASPESAAARPAPSRLTTLAHTGSLQNGRRDLRPLLDALEQLSRSEGREFELVLAGEDCREVAATWRDYSGVTVDVRGQVTRPAAAQLQHDADALVLALANTDFDATYTPAKIFEYAFTGKPMIALAREDSDIGKLVERHNLGVASFDPEKIAGFMLSVEKGEWSGGTNLHELTADAQFGKLVERVEQCLERA